MIVYVDIDDTICSIPDGFNGCYEMAQPLYENIKIIDNMYEDGHTIIYWTARGTVTGVDWRQLTEKQLLDWGAKYHLLKFGKPVYDLLICDKAIEAQTFFKR